MSKIFSELQFVSAAEIRDILSEGNESRSKFMLLTCLQFVVGLEDASSDSIRAKSQVADFARAMPDSINTEIFGRGPIFLININLSAINFVKLNVDEADFSGSNLTGATFNFSNLHCTRLESVNLTDVTFNRSTFTSARIKNASAVGIKFINTDLSDTNFDDSDLISASFSGCKLSETNFRSSRLMHADFSSEKLVHTSFMNCGLHKIKFCRAEIHNVDFYQSIMREANFQEAILGDNTWKNLDFTGANFCDADMRKVVLDGSNLYKANLTGTGLSRQNMQGGVWRENDISDLELVLDHGPAFETEPTEDQAQPQLAQESFSAVSSNIEVPSLQPLIPIARQDTVLPTQTNTASIRPSSTQPANADRLPLASSKPLRQTVGSTRLTHPVTALKNMPLKRPNTLPEAPNSIFGWFSALTVAIGNFFRQIYWRLLGST